MDISTETIKTLRDQTGVSVMQCKKALEEAGGDIEKALVLLRKRGGEMASKKSDRTLAAGTVASYIHAGGTVGSIVELSCETDFVAKTDGFKSLAYDIAMQVAATNPEFMKYEDVSEEAKVKAREVFAAEVAGKPEEMREKIMEGKLLSYFGERCLLNQPFIKDPKRTVQNLIEEAVQKFGERTEVTRFTRFSVGDR
jgi:elongation factor Ts